MKSAGQLAYEDELTRKPTYGDGSQRKPWDKLSDIARWSWERNPTPRW